MGLCFTCLKRRNKNNSNKKEAEVDLLTEIYSPYDEDDLINERELIEMKKPLNMLERPRIRLELGDILTLDDDSKTNYDKVEDEKGYGYFERFVEWLTKITAPKVEVLSDSEIFTL